MVCDDDCHTALDRARIFISYNGRFYINRSWDNMSYIYKKNDDDVQFMLGEDMVIPQVFVSLIERAARDVIVEDIPFRENTQQFRSFSRSNQLFTKRSGIEGEQNMCGVPLEVADHDNIAGPQFDDVFGCLIEINAGQYNHKYNKMYNDMNNYRNNEPIVRPIHEDIITDMKTMYGIQIMYSKTHQALNYMLSLTYGTYEETFQLLQSFGYALEQKNPSTITDLQCDEDVITVYGTLLKRRFGGTMFVATAQDGNEQMYPIAFRYGDSENNLSWEWFLDFLKGALDHIDDLVFISDQHAIIEAGISKVFLDTTHTICCWHFSIKIKKRYHRKDVAAIMDKATRAYTELKYNRHMEELRNLHHNTYDYVNVVGPYKWSHVHYPDIRYKVMTTNTTECIKSCLNFVRQLPMLTLAKFIRNILQRWFHDRHRAAQSMCH
ncbi:hypothetical protein Ddye_012005 [Dipteronia dyeriana]|uniref:MULE transposase domain-containing protein n=1 Tax=Dipteronia dyeriana TaxID=168575 RepID=A0AAE0CI08_9ROSI|nr:hypothetical protein Ddye_012005 [Dipteronia dyeriana]